MLNYCANGPSGYNLTNSLRFRQSASAYLTRTFATGGTSRQIQTVSFWVKRGTLGSTYAYIFGAYDGSSGFDGGIQFLSDNLCVQVGGVSSTLTTTQVFRDPSAWYHIVVAIDTTQATSSNRVKVYVNGNQVTSFSTATYPTQNSNINFLYANGNNRIGTNWNNNASTYFDGYLTEINFIDGQALTPSSFGSTNALTGVWQPKQYTGTYGTNGFYLNFSNIALTSGSNTGLGKDYSGNGNYWNTNNISVTAGTTYDAMTDVPTLTSATVANYAVLNPLTAQGVTTSEANLSISGNTGSNQRILGTIATGTSGKFYWEVTTTNAFQAVVGVATQSSNIYMEAVGDGAYYYAGNTKINGVAGPTLSSYTNGDVIGVAFDSSTGKIYFSKNGTWQNSGDPTAGTGSVGTLTSGNDWFAGSASQGTSTYNHKYNFGQRPFTYTPPTGFNRLNTFNLPTSTIVKGNTVMDATLYTGNGSTQTITNAGGFRPDLVWAKNRNTGSTTHGLFDSVRGVTAYLSSNNTNAEANLSGVTSFNSNGFSLGADWNQNTNTFVGWQWQAGQGTTSSNTNGSITSTVSVNASAGFSVVTYTGTGVAATIGHGLGVAPSFYIVKRRNAAGDYWCCYHVSIGATKGIYLNTTDAAGVSDLWNNTAPTSSVFSVKTTTGVNASGGTYVAYCWAEIVGFSKFGSYTGNGSTDGPFVYTGFRPKYVMIKVTSIANVWLIIDSVRNTYNVANLNLNANDSAAENTASTGAWLDFTSNGFKIRNGTDGAINTSSNNYIYACFAENPFKNALAR